MPPTPEGLPATDPGHEWTSPATILSATAVVLSLAALYFGWSSATSAERQAEAAQAESRRRALLEVVSARAYLAQDITGRRSSPDAPDRVLKGLRGPRIDIVLRNRGSGEALITDATVKFQRSERLRACYFFGGPLRSSFDYEIGVPDGTRPPFTVTRTLNFRVPSGRHDRFTLSVGPQVVGESVAPWIGVVSVVLHHADGRDLEQGPFAIVDAGGLAGVFAPSGPPVSWIVAKPDDISCMRGNALTVAGVVGTPGLTVADELTALHRALAPYR